MVDILILDFNKEWESRECLKSLSQFCLFPHRVIFYSNGGDQDYVYNFYKEGLIDICVFNKINSGLGIGTRDLFNLATNNRCLYFQNDQILGRPIQQEEVDRIFNVIEDETDPIQSVSIAGNPCGNNIYSERAHFICRDFYLMMESEVPLGRGGAGPFHNEPWREGAIQNFYEYTGLVHLTDYPRAVIDNGRRAIRQNKDGSIWEHQPDTKRLWLKQGPVKEIADYPKFTSEEWDSVLLTQEWTDGKIPEREREHSFTVKSWH